MQSGIIKIKWWTNVMGENRIFCQAGIHFEAFLNNYLHYFEKVDDFLTDQINFRLSNSPVSLSNDRRLL